MKTKFYEKIRRHIGSDRTTKFFSKEEQIKILEFLNIEIDEEGESSKYIFQDNIEGYMPQKTTDTHPNYENLEFLASIFEDIEENEKIENFNVHTKARVNPIVGLLSSLNETDFSRLIQSVYLEDKNTIVIKLIGGEE